MPNRIIVLTIILYLNSAETLRPLATDKRYKDDNLDIKTSLQLLRAASKIKDGRREIADKTEANDIESRKDTAGAPELLDPDAAHVGVVEKELLQSLREHKPVAVYHPYVEKKGINDFLVMQPDLFDPFVTVIPNSIYYGIEKKCVNWLDDCTLRGIRSKLLSKVRWPY